MKSRFGPFTLDAATRQLRRDDRDIHLSRKAFDVLSLLIGRRPNVVPKEELFKAIWPDTFVTDANLNVVVGEIRRALGDSAHAPQYIRTAHGVGYAFSGAATEADAPAAAPASPVRAWLVTGDRTLHLTRGDNFIGRDMKCDVWLDDVSVSRRHAVLRLNADGAMLEDLRSMNGTFVGSTPVERATSLSDGDRIRIGEVEVEFRHAGKEQEPTKRIRRKG